MVLFFSGFKDKDQEAASFYGTAFSPVVQSECSPKLKPFLCALVTPVCNEEGKTILPCKGLCEAASKGCKTKMEDMISYILPSCEM